MPTSSIVQFPAVADVFSTMQPYSQGTFDNFLQPALFGAGIFIGALVIVFVIGALIGGFEHLYDKLSHMIHGTKENKYNGGIHYND